MRNLLVISLALLSTTRAFADVEDSTMTPLAAGTDACKELGGDAKTCKQVATTKVKDVGPATLYRVEQEGTVTFAVVVGDSGKLAMTAPVTVNTGDCGAGSCDSLSKATPALKTFAVHGAPTIALDLTLARTRQSNEGPKTPRNYTVRDFLACRLTNGAWSCKKAEFGSLDEQCTASLSAAGAIKSRCEHTTFLW